MKNKLSRLSLIGSGIAVVALLALWGCGSGDTDSGEAGDRSAGADQFIADENSTGRLELAVNSSSFAVGQVEGFRVRAVNGRTNTGVSGLRIVCDTEAGLALVEPSDGIEITDSNGEISGVLGCAAPGSFQVGCRAPSGGIRKFVTVVCSGNVPDGFDGFSGAGGGGLGGSVDDDDNANPGGSNLDGVTVDDITYSDVVGDNVLTLDAFQNGDCDNDPSTNDPEPFQENTVKVKFINDTNNSVTITSFEYSVPNVNGSTFNSGEFAANTLIPANGGNNEINFLLTSFGGGGKAFVGVNGSTANISTSGLGSRTITYTFGVTSANGETAEIVVNSSINLVPIDNCA